MASKRLEGSVALVTGAGGGERGGGGAGIARVLGAAGAVVAVNDLRLEYAEATVAQLRSLGAEAFALAGDVSDPAQANRMVRAVVDRCGRIDILVNNASALGRAPAVERMPDDLWHHFINVSMSGPFHMCRAAVPFMMARRHGRIINIASLAGARISFVSGACYTAAKSGLLGFTRHLATEVAEHGMTVNAILPVGIKTGRLRADMPPAALAAMEAARPTKRLVLPEEIGELVAFFASEAASQVNGVAIPIDNGSANLAGDFSRYRASGKDTG